MIIDIIFLVFMAIAVFKGFQKGLIVAVFSIVAFVVGLAAALKLSALVAVWLGESTNINTKWLPFLAFVLVFIAVVLIIHWGAKFIEKAVELAFLGWVNKLAGVVLYAVLYALILSVLLFFAAQMHVFTEQTIEESRTYGFIQPWGPGVLDAVGKVIPLFSNVFADLQEFFEKLSGKLST
jgi:membrane protein required for colicin V production